MPDTPRTTAPPPPPPTDVAAGYRPISGLAIAALGVAVLTAVIVLVIVAVSLAKGRAILAEWVVALAVLGLALSVVARWQIRRSEGTRAGLGLAGISIW